MPLPSSLVIVFEDDDFVVFNKPAGLLTQKTMDPKREDLYTLAQGHFQTLYLHHRLDAGTSGLILMTKSPRYNSYVTGLFRDHRIEKTYSALCEIRIDGDFARKPHWEERWTIENHLAPIKRGKGIPTFMKEVRSGGKLAITDFQLLERSTDEVRVQARPRTGRMHQIRTHLNQVGLPIRGDWLYGRKSADRLYLHAQKLKFIHPTRGELEIICEVPF